MPGPKGKDTPTPMNLNDPRWYLFLTGSFVLVMLGLQTMQSGIQDGLLKSRMYIPPWSGRRAPIIARGGAAHLSGVVFGIFGALLLISGGLSLIGLLRSLLHHVGH